MRVLLVLSLFATNVMAMNPLRGCWTALTQSIGTSLRVGEIPKFQDLLLVDAKLATGVRDVQNTVLYLTKDGLAMGTRPLNSIGLGDPRLQEYRDSESRTVPLKPFLEGISLFESYDPDKLVYMTFDVLFEFLNDPTIASNTSKAGTEYFLPYWNSTKPIVRMPQVAFLILAKTQQTNALSRLTATYDMLLSLSEHVIPRAVWTFETYPRSVRRASYYGPVTDELLSRGRKIRFELTGELFEVVKYVQNTHYPFRRQTINSLLVRSPDTHRVLMDPEWLLTGQWPQTLEEMLAFKLAEDVVLQRGIDPLTMLGLARSNVGRWGKAVGELTASVREFIVGRVILPRVGFVTAVELDREVGLVLRDLVPDGDSVPNVTSEVFALAASGASVADRVVAMEAIEQKVNAWIRRSAEKMGGGEIFERHILTVLAGACAHWDGLKEALECNLVRSPRCHGYIGRMSDDLQRTRIWSEREELATPTFGLVRKAFQTEQ